MENKTIGVTFKEGRESNFNEVYNLITELAALINPQCHFNLKQELIDGDISDDDLIVEIRKVENKLKDFFDKKQENQRSGWIDFYSRINVVQEC